MKYMVALAFLTVAGPAYAKGGGGAKPEDLLKGQIIVSDKSLPTRWSSVPAYVSQLRGMNRGTLWYDKKTGKVKIEYAAFFARPVDDVQVDLAIYDVTGGQKVRKSATEQFMNKGDRVLFNSIEFDKEDYEMNKKYMFAIEDRHVIIATGSFILRGESEHFSGKVTFTDDDVKNKK